MPTHPVSRSVLFDVGGVLVGSRPDPQRIAAIMGGDDPMLVSLVDQAMWVHRDAYDAGCSDREFWDRVSGDCGKPQFDDITLSRLVEYDSMRVHEAVASSVALVEELKAADIVLGILSNAPQPIADEIRRTEWAKNFDYFVFSCEVGSCKPHRAIYRTAIEMVGVDPANIVFFDDRKKNVRAAELADITGLLWTDAHLARADLVKLGYLA